MPGHSFRDYLQLHSVVLAWGFTAILGKLISLPPLDVVVWRTGLAAAGLAIVAMMMSQRLRVSRKTLLVFLATGMVVGLHWILFFLSARLSTASVCLVAMPTVMIWCSLIEPLMDGSRRWRAAELVVGVIIVGAIWLIYHAELAHRLGFTVGLVSAIFAAIFGVWNKQLTSQHPPVVICFWQMVGACLAGLLLRPVFAGQAPMSPSPQDWGWLLVLSLGCTVAAYIGYMDVLRRMSVFTINVVYNMEPVYGIILAALFFGEKERMSPGFYLGAVIIIASVVTLPWINRRLATASTSALP
jgi:drug/metabolite transporter (DMT)-like permease